MCNEIDFNIIFLFIHLQWTIVNTNEYLLLWFYYYGQKWCYSVMILLYLQVG